MTKHIVGLFLALLVFAGVFLSSSSVEAQSGKEADNISVNRTTEIHPDIGPYDPGSVVGEHGYKVFHPGAIKTATVVPLETNVGRMATVSSIRRGATDAWLAWVWSFDLTEWGWDHNAFHDSQSDIWEDEIWADGRLKITTDSSWRKTCPAHRSGSRANCTTTFFQVIPRTIYSETDHHFHSSGYVDDNFMTADSA